jgi:hypothetical protein
MYNPLITAKKTAYPLVVIILAGALSALLKHYDAPVDDTALWSGVVALYAACRGIGNWLKHRQKKESVPADKK